MNGENKISAAILTHFSSFLYKVT